MITVGRVIRPQGNRGEVVILSETDFGSERFRPGALLQIKRNGAVEALTVTTSREHNGRWIVGLDAARTIDAAEALRGLEVKIPADQLQSLDAGGHYVHDLAGCRVETTAQELVGIVRDVQLGAGLPLLVVDGQAGEVLVPFIDEICRRVDTSAKVIVIAPPEGLIELNELAKSRQKAEGTRHK